MTRPVLLLCALFFGCQTPREPEHAAVAITAPPAPATPAKSTQARRITIVGTNDVHGWVSGMKERFPK